MKKNLIWIVLGLLAAIYGGYYLYTNNSGATKNEKLKVGIVLPLTGEMSFYGELLKNSFQMSIDTAKVEYLFEDSKGEIKDAIGIVNKFISIEKIDVLVTFLPPICEAVNPIAIKNKMLHFTFTQSPSIATGNDFTLKHWAASEDEALIFTEFIKGKSPKKVAFLRHLYPDADLAFNKISKPTLEKAKISIVDVPFSLETRDFKNLTAKIKGSDPDWTVVQTLAFNYKNILTDFRNAGLINNVIGDLNYFNVKDLNDFNDKIYEGIPFVNMTLITSEKYKEYLNIYKARFDKESTVFGVFAYDLGLVLNSIDKSNISKKAVIDYYRDNKIDGYGGRITYDQHGNLKLKYTVSQYKNGEIVSYE